MQAMEFETSLKNNTITIPINLKLINKKIEVIILYDEKTGISKLPKLKILSKTSKIGIKTKGYKFSREEANER